MTITLLMGCAHESAPAATTAPVTEPEADSTATNTDTTSSEATEEPAVTTAVVETPPIPEPAEEPPPPVPVDMTEAAAPELCAGLVAEPETLTTSAFKRGGVTLAGEARADVLECHYQDPTNGEVVAAYLVIRVPGEGYATTEPLGEAYDVPGMASAYRLGRVERTATGVRIRVTGTDTYYPETGDGSSGRAEPESSRLVVTCVLEAEYNSYACERS